MLGFRPSVFLTSILFLTSCSTARTITLSPHSRLSEIRDPKIYEDLKKKYTVTHEINFGPDPELAKQSLRLAKKDINFEVPDRRIIFTATFWDLPLIKSYLISQRYRTGSLVGEELRNQLMDEHRRYTQVLVSVDSYVNPYFNWTDWTLWLEDQFGRTYVPAKTQETSEEDIELEVDQVIMGKQTLVPSYKIYKDYGTLYFDRLDLSVISPIKIVFLDKEERRRVELNFKFKGKSPNFPKPSDPPTYNIESAEEVPVDQAEPIIDKRELMRLHFLQATTHYKNKKYHAAIREWQRVLEIDPTHELSKRKIEKSNEMIDLIQADQKKYNTSQRKRQMQIHFLMGSEHFKAGNYEEAITEWKEVLKLDPDHQLSLEKIEKAKEKLENY